MNTVVINPITEHDVGRDRTDLARAMLDFCSRDLRATPPELAWYRGARLTGLTRTGAPRDVLGLFDGQTVSVGSEQSEAELLHTIAHECKHAAQAKSDPLFWDYCAGAEALDRYERDADRYAQDAVCRFRQHGQDIVRAKAFVPILARACMRRGW